jgi:ribosomal-protein-alanine N-acetyltransferase
MIWAATPLDAPDFAAIHRHCFEDSWSEESFRALLSDPAVFGFLFSEGTVESCLLARAAVGEAEILTVATIPKVRRKGLASLLLEAAIQEARTRGVGSVFLEVHENNRFALNLYANFGFRMVGKRPGYYQSKHGPAGDALILRRDLNPERPS